jgi:5'-3' exonuclease
MLSIQDNADQQLQTKKHEMELNLNPEVFLHQGLVAIRRGAAKESSPPQRILFLLHGIRLLVNCFQLNSFEQNSASSISKFRFKKRNGFTVAAKAGESWGM